MTRRKYRFPDRATAEDAYVQADRQRLLTEWFATALLTGTTVRVGAMAIDGAYQTVGYVALQHTALVYCVTHEGPPHCIRGIWDTDSVGDVIAGLMRHDDTHDLGRLLDKARQEAWAALLAGGLSRAS